MDKRDRIIADLVDALDRIRREARDGTLGGGLDYICGVATQAIANCNAERMRNSDGYLVARQD